MTQQRYPIGNLPDDRDLARLTADLSALPPTAGRPGPALDPGLRRPAPMRRVLAAALRRQLHPQTVPHDRLSTTARTR